MNDHTPLSGFDAAREHIRRFDARVGLYRQVMDAEGIHDPSVAFLHADIGTKPGTLVLGGYTAHGDLIAADTVFADVDDGVFVTEPVDAFQLSHHNARNDAERAIIDRFLSGWVIDMRAIRSYDLHDDRMQTQRACLLAHLGDLAADGQIRTLLFGEDLSGTQDT